MDWKGQVLFLSLCLPLFGAFFCEASFVSFFIRWAFIDLSAGPFSWGPAVGGEGVRTELSLPNVGKTIGAAAGFRSFCSMHFFP